MTQLRFVHAADLHLDSPFKGLRNAAPEGIAGELYEATFRAYDNIIDLCIGERADALFVAGDVYDEDNPSLRAQLKFVEGLRRLDAAGIRSFVCHGNHDPLDGWKAGLTYPDGCHRFGREWERVPVFPNEPDRAVVYGISYPTRDVTSNLALTLGKVERGAFSIGLLHANVGGDSGHAPYAPCSVDDLRQTGVDYWALGHVHTRRILHQREPVVAYPGNPQGRHPNETGARGAYLVEVDDDGNARPDFRATDVVRWEYFSVDIGTLESEQDLLDTLHAKMGELLDGADGRSLVVRAGLSGRGELHRSLRRPNALRDWQEAINRDWMQRSPFVWCERIEDDTTTPFDRAARLAASDFLAEVLQTVERAKGEGELMERLLADLPDLYEHGNYRRYLRDALPSGAERDALIAQAEALAVDLLIEDEA